MPNAILANDPAGRFDREALKAKAAALPPMEGPRPRAAGDEQGLHHLGPDRVAAPRRLRQRSAGEGLKVVAIDYGVKRNILRLLAKAGCDVTVVPATASAEEVLALKPDGVFLSNGPGDPAATGEYAVPVIRALLDQKVPTFGICLGHQLMGLALGGRTVKMSQGHHGANHPVKDHRRQGRDRLDEPRLRGGSEEPARGTRSRPTSRCSTARIAACRSTDRPAFSVQHHPEPRRAPRDSPLPVRPLRQPHARDERRQRVTPKKVAAGSGRSHKKPELAADSLGRPPPWSDDDERSSRGREFGGLPSDRPRRDRQLLAPAPHLHTHLGIAVGLAWVTTLAAATRRRGCATSAR